MHTQTTGFADAKTVTVTKGAALGPTQTSAGGGFIDIPAPARKNTPITRAELLKLGDVRCHVLNNGPNRRKRRADARQVKQRFNNREETAGRTKFRETGFLFRPFRPHYKAAAATL